MKKAAITVLLILMTIFLLPILRLHIQAGREYRSAMELKKERLQKGNYYDGFRIIMGFEKSCHLYYPLSPYYKKSIRELENLGRYYQEKGESKLARYAWLAVKSCIMSARSFYIPRKGEMKTADTRISSLLFEKGKPEKDRIKDPSILFSVLMILGLLMWVGGLITAILLEGKHLKWLFLIFTVGYVIWIISIYLL